MTTSSLEVMKSNNLTIKKINQPKFFFAFLCSVSCPNPLLLLLVSLVGCASCLCLHIEQKLLQKLTEEYLNSVQIVGLTLPLSVRVHRNVFWLDQRILQPPWKMEEEAKIEE